MCQKGGFQNRKGYVKMGRLIIDGNSVYEVDEACLRAKEGKKRDRTEQSHRGRENPSGRKQERNETKKRVPGEQPFL